jgi:hypothetical protein
MTDLAQQIEGPPPRGLYTSEFWLAIVVIVAGTVLRVTDDIDATAWQWAVSSATVGYAGSRALVKSKLADAAGQIAGFKADLALLAADKPKRSPAR